MLAIHLSVEHKVASQSVRPDPEKVGVQITTPIAILIFKGEVGDENIS